MLHIEQEAKRSKKGNVLKFCGRHGFQRNQMPQHAIPVNLISSCFLMNCWLEIKQPQNFEEALKS